MPAGRAATAGRDDQARLVLDPHVLTRARNREVALREDGRAAPRAAGPAALAAGPTAGVDVDPVGEARTHRDPRPDEAAEAARMLVPVAARAGAALLADRFHKKEIDAVRHLEVVLAGRVELHAHGAGRGGDAREQREREDG